MISKLEYDKEYYFFPKKGEVGGVGFVRLIRPAGDKIHYRSCTKYEDLYLNHPVYDDEKDIEPYSEDAKEFRDWNHSNNIHLCYSDEQFLKERLFEIKDIKEFPMCVEISEDSHIVIGPRNARHYREWQLYNLLND
jgi:hypothetical protein